MTKQRVLIAWELGGNFGHLGPLLPVARRLQQQGHEVVFAVKDLEVARQLIGSDNFRFEQAPISSAGNVRISEPASFADILAEAGFDDGKVLHALLGKWQGLFELYRPTVVVSQYAPAAQLAARLAALPCLAVGTGFEYPPDVTPFPCFRPWLKIRRTELLSREQKLLGNINGIFTSAGLPDFARLQQAISADLSLLSTLPELDHYRGRGKGQYIGPLFLTDDGEEWHWPSNDGTLRIFVYLRPFREFLSVLAALKRNGAHVIAVIPGIGDKERANFIDDHLRISTQRLKLATIMRDADLVVSHGGHGMAAATLLAGLPSLTIPENIEQWLTTRNLERLGTGIGVTQRQVAFRFAAALDRLTSDPTYRDRAQTMARKYACYDQSRVVERLVNTIERLPSAHAGNVSPAA